MKKIYSFLVILIIAAAFSATAVCAADTEAYDFDGKFTVDVPKGADFGRSVDDDYILFTDISDGLIVMYYEGDIIKEENMDAFYSGFEESGFDRTGESGDLTFFENEDGEVASTYDDGIVVLVMSTGDLDVKDLGESIKFS